MRWRLPATIATLVSLATPAAADEKGAALVQAWFARIAGPKPVAALTTTTYRMGKQSAVRKGRLCLPGTGRYTRSYPYQCDDDYPLGLYNDPLQDNLNPLATGAEADRSSQALWRASNPSSSRSTARRCTPEIVMS